MGINGRNPRNKSLMEFGIVAGIRIFLNPVDPSNKNEVDKLTKQFQN